MSSRTALHAGSSQRLTNWCGSSTTSYNSPSVPSYSTELRGPMPGGTYVTWRYDLTRETGDWKLRDESWETRFNGEK